MLIRRFVIQESADRLVGKLLATLTRHLTHAFPGTQDGAGCQEKNQGRRSGVKFFLDISFHRTLSHWERHGSFEKAPWMRGPQLNKFDRSLNFFAIK